MAVDNTHTKYLKGSDKKAWNNYKELYEAQKKLDNFLSNFNIPVDLKEGEEFDIPVRGRGENKRKKNK